MLQSFVLVVFPLAMIFAGLSDLLTMTIPNRLSLLLALGLFVAALLGGLSAQQVLMHLICGGVVLAIGFSFFALGWIGGGDAKLAAATALWLGFGVLLEYALLAAIFGGALTLTLLSFRSLPLPLAATGATWLQRLLDRNGGIPYGVALAAAGLTVYPSSPIWQAAF